MMEFITAQRIIFILVCEMSIIDIKGGAQPMSMQFYLYCF